MTPRLMAKESGKKQALKILKKCEKGFKKMSQKPDIENPNAPALCKLYDWIFENQEEVKHNLMKKVRGGGHKIEKIKKIISFYLYNIKFLKKIVRKI